MKSKPMQQGDMFTPHDIHMLTLTYTVTFAFNKEQYFCAFLYASKDGKALPKWSLLDMFPEERLFPKMRRAGSLLEGRKNWKFQSWHSFILIHG